MPWDGAGNFNRTDGTRTGSNVWTQAKNAGVKILSVDHDTQDEDIATGLENCVARDGQNAASANLPMGGFKHTNTAVASSRTDYARASQITDGALVYAGTSSGTNTITATTAPAITAYVTGMRIHLKIGNANTGAATLNLNSVGAVNIKRFSPYNGNTVDLVSGDLIPGYIAEFIYDGTQFILLNPLDKSQSGIYQYGGTAGGTANAITLSMTPSISSSYQTGAMIYFRVSSDNTSSTTININSIGVANIKKAGVPGGALQDLEPGDLTAAQVAFIVYDSAEFVLINPSVSGINSWAPTIGGVNVTSPTTNKAKYWREGKRVYFYIDVTASASGNVGGITYTLPVTAADALYGGGAAVKGNSTTANLGGLWLSFGGSTSTAAVISYNNSTFYGAGQSGGFTINGSYEAA